MLAPVLGALLGFNLYNLLFVETEVAEVAQARAEAVEERVASARVARTVEKPARATTAKRKTTIRKTTAGCFGNQSGLTVENSTLLVGS